ncbi:MAG: hypothetical protein FJW39_18750 [Acidobacteria bacterium]|nr:hypothetical protein [Acidobacteriota bacterium]
MLASDFPSRTGRTAAQALVDLIKHQQKKEVRESYGTGAHECFTWIDLDNFKARRVPDLVVQRLKKAPDFDILTGLLRAMPPTDREAAFTAARNTAKPTWAMIVRIHPDGQTEAGRAAELMIADAITGAFESAVNQR